MISSNCKYNQQMVCSRTIHISSFMIREKGDNVASFYPKMNKLKSEMAENQFTEVKILTAFYTIQLNISCLSCF